jgi:hypothetical protein
MDMGNREMKERSMNRRESMAQQNAAERWVDRLVRVGAPLMLALSSLSVLAVMVQANAIPPSALVPMAGLVAAIVFYFLGQQSSERRS